MNNLWQNQDPVALIPSIIQIVRHFMVAKDHAACREDSDEHAPFYGNKMGHFITSEAYQIDEL